MFEYWKDLSVRISKHKRQISDALEEVLFFAFICGQGIAIWYLVSLVIGFTIAILPALTHCIVELYLIFDYLDYRDTRKKHV